MGIRYEKGAILNWINEMGKFLRLVVARWEGLDKEAEDVDVAAGYVAFFGKDRAYFEQADDTELFAFAGTLDPEQVRPLARLLLFDGLIHHDKPMIAKARRLLEHNMRETASFSFEDYSLLAKINENLD